MKGLFAELKRRNVIKVATAYLITAWMIMQVVDVLRPYMNLPVEFGSVVIMLLIIGFPLACVFAWAFELTPDGIKRTVEVDIDSSVTKITGRKLDLMIIALLLLGLGLVSYDAYFADTPASQPIAASDTPPQETSKKSIAVLPFQNMSADVAQEYFADGLAEELLNVLARVKQLKVAARTSSFFFKGKNEDIREIGRQLDVNYVLEGSVRKSGSRIRVTAQLIQASDGYHLFSETYDYDSEDIFLIQDDISKKVVEQLKITLLEDEFAALTAHGTQIAAAQEAYMLGRFHMRSRTPKGLSQAAQSFTRALQLDPAYQMALSGLLDTYYLQVDYAGRPQADYQDKAARLLATSLSESKSAELLTSEAAYQRSLGEFQLAQQLYRQAIDQNQNYVQAYHWLSSLLGTLGQGKEADALMRQALQLDPLSEVLLINVGSNDLRAGKAVEAEKSFRRAIEVNPNSSLGHRYLMQYYWFNTSEWDKAWVLADNNNVDFANEWAELKIAFWLTLGEVERAKQEVATMMEVAPQSYLTMRNRLYVSFYDVVHYDAPSGPLLQQVESHVKQFPSAENKLNLAYTYITFGRNAEGIELILSEYPDMQSDALLSMGPELFVSILLANAWMMEQNPKAEQLVKRIENSVQSMLTEQGMENWGMLPIQVLSLMGQRQKALELLRLMLIERQQLANIWYFEYDPNYWLLREEPEFKAVIQQANELVEARKAELQQSQTGDSW